MIPERCSEFKTKKRRAFLIELLGLDLVVSQEKDLPSKLIGLLQVKAHSKFLKWVGRKEKTGI